MRRGKLFYKEDEIIEKYLAGTGYDALGVEYGASGNSIAKLLRRRNVPIRLRKIITDDAKQQITAAYASGQTMEEVGNTFDVSAASVLHCLRDANIASRTAEEVHRIYPINENYFDAIDTQEKAYILGFIYADGGNIQKSNFVSINLNAKDIDILYKISDKIYLENSRDRVSTYERIRKDKKFTHCNLNINSKHVCGQLAKLGCGPRKSLTLTFPEWLTDPDLQRHFIRGYYDGDGGLYLPAKEKRWPQARMISTTEFSNKISNIITNILNINTSSEKYPNNLSRVIISGNHQIKIFLDWLYKDATIYLDRKYNLYQEFALKYNNYHV